MHWMTVSNEQKLWISSTQAPGVREGVSISPDIMGSRQLQSIHLRWIAALHCMCWHKCCNAISQVKKHNSQWFFSLRSLRELEGFPAPHYKQCCYAAPYPWALRRGGRKQWVKQWLEKRGQRLKQMSENSMHSSTTKQNGDQKERLHMSTGSLPSFLPSQEDWLVEKDRFMYLCTQAHVHTYTMGQGQIDQKWLIKLCGSFGDLLLEISCTV